MLSFRRALRATKALGWADRLEVLRILGLALVVELGLRTLPLPRLAGLLRVDLDLRSEARGHPMEVPPPAWAVRRIHLTRAVLRYSRQTCLRNSLIVATRLRSLSPKLRIGVKKTEGALTAHAWLEMDGFFFDAGALEFEPVHLLSSSSSTDRSGAERPELAD